MNMTTASRLAAQSLTALFNPPPEAVNELDIIWGTDAIARVIGRTRRQTHYALAKGDLPAKQVAGRWCASRRALTNHFGADS
jgi:hypothetical protein